MMIGELTQKIHLQTPKQSLSVEEALKSPRLVRKSLEVPLVLQDQPLFVGRDETAVDLLIPSHFVSRRHALLFKKGTDYFVQDLHSKNGTFINNKKLPSGTCCAHPLKNGDRIRFNIIEFLFVIPEETKS
ncbi:MAG: FHA domain-containing protein [Deltaproteobacteria bacterium]|nr:FHA domain-containing protein [Deltaproteobacteria bacterium]